MAAKKSQHSASGSYALPSDAPEHERLDWQSRALTEMMGGHDFVTDISALALAQTASPFRAIEAGPGTGLRTIVLSQAIPSDNAEIFGVDISPVPALYERPKNVEFVQADIMDISGMNQRFAPGSFNFVTHRMLVAGLNMQEYARACFNLLQPGGRVEFQDTALRWFDADGMEISQGYKWLKVFNAASAKLSLDSLGPEKLPQWLREAGFADVESKTYRWLTSEEDEQEIAKYTVQVLNSKVFPGLVRKTIEKAGVNEFEGLSDIDGVVQDFKATVTGVPKGTHTKFWVTTARKP